VRWPTVVFALIVGFATAANAESAKILKVLPQFLDVRGHSSLSPSLFDRDAYQAKLRAFPTNRSGLQFMVNWKARGYDELTLRIEAKGGPPLQPKTITLEEKVQPRFFSRWSSLAITGDEYRKFGEMTSWKATLWHGTNEVAEQKSFLW